MRLVHSAINISEGSTAGGKKCVIMWWLRQKIMKCTAS